jgi:putative oxidoreductase
VLLSLYFLYPGINKIPRYEDIFDYMIRHNIPFVNFFLPITIMLQIVLGLMLILGCRIKEVALNLAVLILFIKFGMLVFWNDHLKPSAGQEMQNSIKT